MKIPERAPDTAESARAEKAQSVTILQADVAVKLSGLRLDQAVAALFESISREEAKKFIAIGAVWVNGSRTQIVSRTVSSGDTVSVHIGRMGCRRYYEADPAAILYEDEYLLFYRKEPGVATQGVMCDNYNNLFSALQRYVKKRGGAAPYLGMHQRLDLDTSGVVLFTLSQKANRSIHYQFKDHRVKKIYRALVAGIPDFTEQRIENYIYRHASRYCCSDREPGALAVTHYRVLATYETCSLVEARPETGRTHQLRLQLSHMGHPILGDRLYGTVPPGGPPRTMLHALSLTIVHPVTKQELTVQAPLFDDMLGLLHGAQSG
jgi:23S rRNA pseudouridine1911/1915/1917 synthase